MKDYKKLWDELYKYLDDWSCNISLEYDEDNIYETVARVQRAYTISTVMDKMMDLEADVERDKK